MEDFVDLCSVANISIFILDGGLHGYYIHGQNPFGFSEGSSEHLQECLKSESMEKGRKRGLIQKGDERDESLCTFELYMPTNFKDKFEKVYFCCDHHTRPSTRFRTSRKLPPSRVWAWSRPRYSHINTIIHIDPKDSPGYVPEGSHLPTQVLHEHEHQEQGTHAEVLQLSTR